MSKIIINKTALVIQLIRENDVEGIEFYLTGDEGHKTVEDDVSPALLVAYYLFDQLRSGEAFKEVAKLIGVDLPGELNIVVKNSGQDNAA